MLNGKMEPVSPTAIGKETFIISNALHTNGVLFTIGKKIDYFPNIFEYLGIDNSIDSAYQFINSYSRYEFSEAASVPGGINADGQTEYLDSIVVLRNSLFSTLGQINSEDSTYWMLVPTNDQWTRMVNEYHDYFDYANTVNKRDSMQEANTRLAILSGTVFSRTINPMQRLPTRLCLPRPLSIRFVRQWILSRTTSSIVRSTQAVSSMAPAIWSAVTVMCALPHSLMCLRPRPSSAR